MSFSIAVLPVPNDSLPFPFQLPRPSKFYFHYLPSPVGYSHSGPRAINNNTQLLTRRMSAVSGRIAGALVSHRACSACCCFSS